MRTPGQREDRNETVIAVCENPAIVGARHRPFGMHLAQKNAALPSSNGKGDLPRLGCLTVYQRKVGLFDCPLSHGNGKTLCRNGMACGEYDAAGLSVKTGDGAKNVGGVSVTVGECVGKRIVVMPVRGVCRHVAAFGANGDVLVLVKKGKGKVTGNEISVALSVLHGKREQIARRERGAYGDAGTV